MTNRPIAPIKSSSLDVALVRCRGEVRRWFKPGESFNALNHDELAASIVDELRIDGVSPVDISLEKYVEMYGVRALLDAAEEHDGIPDSTAWEISWSMGNVTIADSTGGSIILTAAHALRVAAAISEHAGDRADEPQPDAAA